MHSQNVPEDHLKSGNKKLASQKPAPENNGESSTSADKSVSSSAGSKENTESDQVKLDTIKKDMTIILAFIKWCEHCLDGMGSCKYENQPELISAIYEFKA